MVLFLSREVIFLCFGFWACFIFCQIGLPESSIVRNVLGLNVVVLFVVVLNCVVLDVVLDVVLFFVIVFSVVVLKDVVFFIVIVFSVVVLNDVMLFIVVVLNVLVLNVVLLIVVVLIVVVLIVVVLKVVVCNVVFLDVVGEKVFWVIVVLKVVGRLVVVILFLFLLSKFVFLHQVETFFFQGWNFRISVTKIDFFWTLIAPIEWKRYQRFQSLHVSRSAESGTDFSLFDVFIEMSTAGAISVDFHHSSVIFFEEEGWVVSTKIICD